MRYACGRNNLSELLVDASIQLFVWIRDKTYRNDFGYADQRALWSNIYPLGHLLFAVLANKMPVKSTSVLT
jgi:hypothetical protein